MMRWKASAEAGCAVSVDRARSGEADLLAGACARAALVTLVLAHHEMKSAQRAPNVRRQLVGLVDQRGSGVCRAWGDAAPCKLGMGDIERRKAG